MNYKNNSLAEDFTANPVFAAGYEDFMNELLHIVHNEPMSPHLGDTIKSYALNFVRQHPLGAFDNFSPVTYTRNYLGRDPEDHWEALVMSWQKGNRTAIHAHPQFTGYTFADGEFLVEIFEPTKTGVRLKEQKTINDIQGLYAIGEAGRFDNHIHRITCLSETAHSLHIYSDDALKGLKIPDSNLIP